MAITAYVPNLTKARLMEGYFDFETDTLKAVLLDSGAIPFDIDNDNTYSDVSSHELSTGSGYTVGGTTVTTPSVDEDDTNDKGTFTCDTISWTCNSTSGIGPFSAMAIYDDTTADDAIVALVDWDESISVADTEIFQATDLTISISG